MAPDDLDHDPDRLRLAEFSERLKKARGDGHKTPQDFSANAAVGVALRLGFNLLAAVILGLAVGWFLDRSFRTSPFLLIVFFFIGTGAGFWNVILTARKLDEERLKQSGKTDSSGH
jgi:ATP synthase protein I